MAKSGEIGKRSKIQAVNPIIRKTLQLIDKDGVLLKDLARDVGVHYMTYRHWRKGGNAQIDKIQSTLNALGYDLVIQKLNLEDDI